MTSLDAYKKFLLKINKNDTNTNVNVNKGTFVLIFNEQSKKWLRDKIERDANNYRKNEVSTLLKYDVPLVKIRNTKEFSEFELPPDFFEYENSYSIADRDKCKNRKLLNWDFKSKNKGVLDQDDNNNPSFDYEETLINLSENKLLVFRTDFDVTDEYLTYYREPSNIDIQGYKKIDGTLSENVDPDLIDVYVDEIIDRCATEAVGNYGNIEQYQINKTKQ